jgi:hypothetical protein
MINKRTRLQEINAELGVLHLKTVALEEERRYLCLWCSQPLKEEDRCEHFTLHKICCSTTAKELLANIDGWHYYMYR